MNKMTIINCIDGEKLKSFRDRVYLANENGYESEDREGILAITVNEFLALMDLYHEANKICQVTNTFPNLKKAIDKVDEL